MAMRRPNASSTSEHNGGTSRRLSEPTYPGPNEKRITVGEKQHSINRNSDVLCSREETHSAIIEKLSSELEKSRREERNLSHELEVVRYSESVLKISVNSLNEQIIKQTDTISRSQRMLSILPDTVKNLKIIFNETKKMRKDKTTHETTQENMSDIIADLAEDNYKRLEETAFLKLSLTGKKFEIERQDSAENASLRSRIHELATNEKIMCSKIDELEHQLIGEHFLQLSLSKSLDEAQVTVLALRESKESLLEEFDSLNEHIRHQNTISFTAAANSTGYDLSPKYFDHNGEHKDALEDRELTISRFGGESPTKKRSHETGNITHHDHDNSSPASPVGAKKSFRFKRNVAKSLDLSSAAHSKYGKSLMTPGRSGESRGPRRRFSDSQYVPYADSMESPTRTPANPAYQVEEIDVLGKSSCRTNGIFIDTIPEVTEPMESSDGNLCGHIDAQFTLGDDGGIPLLNALASRLSDATSLSM